MIFKINCLHTNNSLIVINITYLYNVLKTLSNNFNTSGIDVHELCHKNVCV